MVFIPENIPADFKLRRSALFMPSSNSRALEKAKTLVCDVLMFDLEDGVADEMRDAAHANLLNQVKGQDFGNSETVIRTSVPGASGFATDLKIAIECAPDAILLPKISTAEALLHVTRQVSADIKLWAMIETPLALMNLKEICNATPQLTCLIVGPNDLAKDTGTKMDRKIMSSWLMMVIAAARAYDLCVLDSVYNRFRDLDGFAAECKEGAAMGFDGKTLIHPSQIEGANAAFGPMETEIARAKEIIAAFELAQNANKGAIQMDGEMVERMHLGTAKKTAGAGRKIIG